MKIEEYGGEEVAVLRLNSRVKHSILQDYLPAWAGILGTWNKTLNYFDCFAGPGEYVWKGEMVDGSPVISIKVASALLTSNKQGKPDNINLTFIDENDRQLEKLTKKIEAIKDKPSGLRIHKFKHNSETFIAKLLSDAKDLASSFFFIDPYGHPFSLELMKDILTRPRTEIMLNFMYYRIIMDLPNPGKRDLCEKLFAPDNPDRVMHKLTEGTLFSPNKILEYLHNRLGAKYFIPFYVHYGPDEKITSRKIKYILIHYSNHFTAFKLMLNIMWKNSDEGQPLMASDNQAVLFPSKGIPELELKINKKYMGTGEKLTFERLMEENWQWYFLERQYRDVLKRYERAEKIKIERVTSKTIRELSGDDVVIFMR